MLLLLAHPFCVLLAQAFSGLASLAPGHSLPGLVLLLASEAHLVVVYLGLLVYILAVLVDVVSLACPGHPDGAWQDSLANVMAHHWWWWWHWLWHSFWCRYRFWSRCRRSVWWRLVASPCDILVQCLDATNLDETHDEQQAAGQPAGLQEDLWQEEAKIQSQQHSGKCWIRCVGVNGLSPNSYE